MVHGQHRLPSYSSSQFADSQLQSGEMPPRQSAFSERQAGHPLLQLQIIHPPSLGRTKWQTGRLQLSAAFAQTTKPSGAPLIEIRSSIRNETKRTTRNYS